MERIVCAWRNVREKKDGEMPQGTTAATRVPAGHGTRIEHMATSQRSSAGEAKTRDGGVQTDRLAFRAWVLLPRVTPSEGTSEAGSTRLPELFGEYKASEKQNCED